MNIKRIELKNFGKYKEGVFQFKKVNLIKGKNGSGKSTIVEAISYALTGEIRRLPKKNEELIKMSNNGIDLKVSINFDSLDISRELFKDKKISENLLVTGMEEATSSDTQLFLNEELTLDKALLNPINFLQLSGTDKGKYLMDFVANKTFTKEELLLSLKKRVPATILSELVFDEKLSILENIDISLKDVGSNKRSLSKEISLSLDTRRKLLELEEAISNTACDTRKIEVLQKEVNDMEMNIKHSKDTNSKMKELQARKFKLEQFLKSNSEKEIVSRLDNLTSQLNNLDSNYDLSELSQKLNKEMKLLEDIKEKGISLKNLTNNLVNSYNDIVQLSNKVSNIGCTKKCVIDDSINCFNTEGFNNALKIFECKKAKLKESKLEHEADLKKFVNQYKQQESIVKTLMGQQNEFNKKLMEKSKKTNEIISEIAAVNNIKSSIEKNKALLDEINKQLAQIPSEAYNPLILKVLEAKKTELRNLRAQELEIVKLKENKKLVEIERSKLEEKNLKLENLKVLEKSLKKEKLSLIENGVKPLLSDINELLEKFGFSYKAFIKNDGKKATLGLLSNNNETEISTLSTGETMILMIGLLNGIYNFKKSKFRPLFIDDIDNLDEDNLNKLLSNIDVLKEFFDTVILVGVLENLNTDNLNDINIMEC